jgi:hypothetical protein
MSLNRSVWIWNSQGNFPREFEVVGETEKNYVIKDVDGAESIMPKEFSYASAAECIQVKLPGLLIRLEHLRKTEIPRLEAQIEKLQLELRKD